jgi:hypothetical protein
MEDDFDEPAPLPSYEVLSQDERPPYDDQAT